MAEGAKEEEQTNHLRWTRNSNSWHRLLSSNNSLVQKSHSFSNLDIACNNYSVLLKRKAAYLSFHVIKRHWRQSPFKAGHVTRRPSLKCLLGSVANLAILLINLATFHTTLATFLPKAPSNKFSHLKNLFGKFYQLLISDLNDKKHTFFHLNYSRGHQRCLAVLHELS